MKFINKLLFIGASAVCLGATAGETIVYDLRDRTNFDINRQFSVDKDEEPWMWGSYNVNGEDVSGPEQYNSSYTDGYYSSAYYTPDLNLGAGTYKIYTKPRKRSSDIAVAKNPNLYILLAQGDMTESAYNAGKMKEIGHLNSISYASTYSGDAFAALPLYEIEFTIDTPGLYKIAFFNKDASVTLHGTYIVATDGTGGGTVTPDPGTDPEDPEVDPDDPTADPDDPGESGEDPAEPSQPLEPVSLPFADSFAGASFGRMWEVDEVKGKVNWEATGNLTTQLPIMNVYDGDGGMAVFRGWDGSDGDYARLATAPITKASSTAPVIEFMFGHSGARATTDKIKVQVQCDGKDWQDVKGAEIATYIPELENGGWTYYKFPLDSYIGDCTTYRVGLLGVCERLNVNIPVDAVKIYNASSKDAAIQAFSVPEEVTAGKKLEISLSIENLGASLLKASDYSVEIASDYPGAIELKPVDIPAYSVAVLSAAVEMTAEDVLNGPAYSFTAKVNVPGNASGENLTSSKLETEVVFVGHKVPGNPKASSAGSGQLTLTWESVKDLSHKALGITENFNNLPERRQEERPTADGKTETVWIDGTKGNFNGFVSLDFDKQDGGSYYSTSGSEFQVFKDFMTGSMPQGHTGRFIGLTLPGNIQQDDWLISPKLNAAESSLINFAAKIAYIHRESDNYNNSLEVLYATEDYDRKNPSAAFRKVIYSNTSKATTGDLPHDGLFHWLRLNNVPSEAKYVAIHFNTKSAMQTGVWVDLLTITETDQYPLEGYHVYKRNEGRLTEKPLAPEVLSYAIGSGAVLSDLYYVTALYSDGESAPSDLFGDPSGVTAIEEGETDAPARYFNLQGLEVTNPRSGEVLIRLQGNKATKIIVR